MSTGPAGAAPPLRAASVSPRLAWTVRDQIAPGLALGQDARIDALLAWDLLTGHARHGGPAALDHRPVLLQFAAIGPSPAHAAAGLTAWCALPEVADDAPLLRAALQPSMARAPQSVIHTARLPHGLLPALLAGVQAGAIERFELGPPCPADALGGLPAPWPVRPGASLVHTLGVIDDGCGFAHAALRRPDGGSRLLALWDQSAEGPWPVPWRRHTGATQAPPYAYGAELSGFSLDGLLTLHPGLGERAERALYAAIGRAGWGAPGRDHGHRVLQLLTARDGPADDIGLQAAEMPIVFVQLPTAVYADTAGHGLGMHVVDGARYIAERTRASATDPMAWHTTITLSLGALAGPHDGSSMAELALDQLAADARVRLVVAAGNGADERVHVQRSVSQQQPGRWLVRLPAGKREHSFVQLWLPEDQPPERFQLLVQGPGMPASPLLRMGYAATLGAAGQPPQMGVVWARRVAQGLRGTMLLLAWGPTAARRDDTPQPLATPGLWHIELQASGELPAEVHGWAERDDRLLGPRSGQRLRFEPLSSTGRDAGLLASHTLGSLANGQRATVAAGHVLSSRRVADHSANGPLRHGQQDGARLCFAPASRSPSLPGLAVPGFFTGQRRTLGGTSAAAPQVARWLVEGRLTEPAARVLSPSLHHGLPVPPDARCLPLPGAAPPPPGGPVSGRPRRRL